MKLEAAGGSARVHCRGGMRQPHPETPGSAVGCASNEAAAEHCSQRPRRARSAAECTASATSTDMPAPACDICVPAGPRGLLAPPPNPPALATCPLSCMCTRQRCAIDLSALYRRMKSARAFTLRWQRHSRVNVCFRFAAQLHSYVRVESELN